MGSKSENVDALGLDVESGKTYYLQSRGVELAREYRERAAEDLARREKKGE
jgi:hypothetical protein